MTDRELMQMSLKELEKLCQTFSYPPDILYDTINALRARLAQPEREWQGLTFDDWPLPQYEYSADFQIGAQWAEAKLREKNS